MSVTPKQRINVDDAVRAFLCDNSDYTDEMVLTDDTRLMEDLSMDSLDMLSGAMSLEEMFDEVIDDAKIKVFVTVGDVRRFIDELNQMRG